MGLLDSILSGGYGGLFGSGYSSPLFNKPEVQQPQYDPMGNYTGITPQAQSPFPMPQQSMPAPGSFAVPTPFNGGIQTQPFQQFAGVPVGPSAPAAPPPPQAALPPNAQLTQGVGAPLQIAPPAQEAPQQVNLPPALGGTEQQNPILRGLQSIGNGGGLLGAVTGNYSDPVSIQRANMKAQFDALVPIVGPQKAMLAVMNPEAGKTILAQALEKQQPTFGVIGENSSGEKAYGFIDPTKKQVTPYNVQGGGEPVTMQGPDGKAITMPQGADPKTWRNEITRLNADVAAGKKTEVQAKAEMFANKMEAANKSISDEIGASLAGKIASGLPLGNYLQSPEYQQYKQASSNFITALLRQESGAAISKSEFDRYEREYMPQPGDSAAVLAQKAETRRIAIEGMKKGAGPGYKPPTTEPGKVRVYNPTTGKIE